MVIRNEDRFIWYSICSILPYVEKFLIFDTESTDKTVEIIKLFNSKKIIFAQKGKVDSSQLVELRQQQIDMVETDWLWLVDGDEVYPKKTVEAILRAINQKTCDGVIVHRYDLIGDIYNHQDESVGAYDQFGKKGHYVLRLINKAHFPNLQVKGDYPNEYFADKNGNSIKQRGEKHFALVDERIFHAMYLRRSTKGANLAYVLNRGKAKIELGKEIPTEELPEVFFQKKPDIVPDVTLPRGLLYTLLAIFITPIKRFKRTIFRI